MHVQAFGDLNIVLAACPGHKLILTVTLYKQAHYEETTKHRKLTWVYALGTAVLKGYFDPKEIELVLSTYQTALLLLFNNGGPQCLLPRSLESLRCLPWQRVTELLEMAELHVLQCIIRKAVYPLERRDAYAVQLLARLGLHHTLQTAVPGVMDALF